MRRLKLTVRIALVAVVMLPVGLGSRVEGAQGATPGCADWTRVAGVSATAPTANQVLITSGAIAAGNYDVIGVVAASDTVAVGKIVHLVRRNSGGAVLDYLGSAAPNHGDTFRLDNVTLTANDTLAAIQGSVAGAASSRYVAQIFYRAACVESVTVAGTVPVSGPLTDAQLRASAVPVSGGGGGAGTVVVSSGSVDLGGDAREYVEQAATALWFLFGGILALILAPMMQAAFRWWRA